LGFDAAIDYRSDDVRQALRTHCPDGIDVYFDNVGGEILDAALAREIAGWMAAGQLRSREDIVKGLARFPEALLMLFNGENRGKLILEVADQ
jgi:NADPH-dependent curcumin reductase CurA